MIKWAVIYLTKTWDYNEWVLGSEIIEDEYIDIIEAEKYRIKFLNEYPDVDPQNVLVVSYKL